jgi:hypothetical protein
MTVQTTSTVTDLADRRRGGPTRRTSPTRRAEGVRRTSDLTGWARVLGEGIHQFGLDRLDELGVLVPTPPPDLPVPATTASDPRPGVLVPSIDGASSRRHSEGAGTGSKSRRAARPLTTSP